MRFYSSCPVIFPPAVPYHHPGLRSSAQALLAEARCPHSGFHQPELPAELTRIQPRLSIVEVNMHRYTIEHLALAIALQSPIIPLLLSMPQLLARTQGINLEIDSLAIVTLDIH